MAAIRTAAFSFRDFLEAILPTLIAVCLFAPYVTSFDSFDLAFIAVALLGYAISSPVKEISSFFYRRIPILRKKIRDVEELRNWWRKNWDYDRLFYTISSDEREYLYLTAAYASCFRTMSFYFLIYAIVQFSYVLKALFRIYKEPGSWWSTLQELRTPLFGGWHLPAYIVAGISVIFLAFLLKDFLQEYRILFKDRGQYVEFARRYHQDKGNIARSVWGTITHGENVVRSAEVRLQNEKGEVIQKVISDSKGRFQFIDKFSYCLKNKCFVRAKSGNMIAEKEIEINCKIVPEFILVMSEPN